MKFDGLIFTLFMVALLLTISISDNITGRTVGTMEENVICVKVPICGMGDVCIKVCLSEEEALAVDRIPAGIIDAVSDAKPYTIGEEKVSIGKALTYTPDVSQTEDIGCIEHIDYCKDKNGKIFKNKCYPYNHENAIRITKFKCNSEGNCALKSAYEDCKKIENPIKYGRCVFSDIGARCIYDSRAITLWGAAAGAYAQEEGGSTYLY